MPSFHTEGQASNKMTKVYPFKIVTTTKVKAFPAIRDDLCATVRQAIRMESKDTFIETVLLDCVKGAESERFLDIGWLQRIFFVILQSSK